MACGGHHAVVQVETRVTRTRPTRSRRLATNQQGSSQSVSCYSGCKHSASKR